MATTTTTTTLNVVSLPVSLAPATGNFSGPACIILNTTGATLSQVQQQHHHQRLLVNEQDYHQTQHLQQQQQQQQHHQRQQQLDLSNHHHNNNNNKINNNNNINLNNIGTTTNNGTVVGVVGVGELVGLVGVGAPVVNVPACPTSSSGAVTTNVLAPTTSETSTSTSAVTLRLKADPAVSMPTVLRQVSAPAPITTNVTTSNVILNVSGVLNNHTNTTTTTTTTTNNNNIKSYNGNNLANDNNNNISYINNNITLNNNITKMKSNICKTTCNNGFSEISSQQLLQTLQQPYQQNHTQHTPELLRCKRRIDFSGLGFTLPRAQPAAVARRNERERNRVKLVNLGFEALREHVPNGRKNKKMSKVETLRAAVQYIKHLQELLHNEPDFLDISELEMCAAAAVAQLTSSTNVADPTVSTSIQHFKSISPPPNSDISCSPSSSLCSDSGSSYDPFIEDDLIDFSRLL